MRPHDDKQPHASDLGVKLREKRKAGAAKVPFRHIAVYGRTAGQAPVSPGPVPQDFTLNSPIGVCMDRHQRVWICDTGNNRVLVLDKTLNRIVRVFDSPDPRGKPFRMPFHVCAHPRKNRIFITDIGNSRVVAMTYDETEIAFDFEFGNTANGGGAPLQDPNGIALVSKADGSCDIHVNDEFFHTETETLRNRCVRYDENGNYVNEIRSVIDPDGSRHDLYWPQGLSADDAGNLYLANTGSYEILKFKADAPVDPDYCVKAEEPVVAHQFKQPTGLASLNIMRDVSVIGERVFVPDHVLNTISVYGQDGVQRGMLCGMYPVWVHGDEPARSPSDPIYYGMEDVVLLTPYVICQAEAPDLFLVSEPFSSRIVKLRIGDLDLPTPPMELVTALGCRRNQPGGTGGAPQFNCATSVAGLDLAPRRGKPGVDGEAALPAYLKYNPFQQLYLAAGKTLAGLYEYWFGDLYSRILADSVAKSGLSQSLLAMDAGNWRTVGYAAEGGGFQPVEDRMVDGFFLPGNLAMAVYHPKEPLLGQWCPGTPLVLMTNFNFGTVSLYQVGPSGKLLNYGTPFGTFGQADVCLRGPQGLAVSGDGEVFIVDSLNNRMSKWMILQTGQVVFIKTFRWDAQDSSASFTPTDVAIDAEGRVVVTDQFNDRLCFFDRDGNSLWFCGRQGYWEEGDPDGEKFMLPTSLAIDGDCLIVNDLVNRALKLFRIEDTSLKFVGGISLFKLAQENGGVWMPFFMHANRRQVHIADSTYNIIQVFEY